MKCIHLCVFLFALFLPSISSRHVQFYRKDYTYIKEYDAFYKIHWDLNGSSWNSAFLTCDDEGATLFYPKVKGEWALVQNLTKKMTVVPNVTDIFVGIHDEFGLSEFITVDGHSTPFPLLASDFHNPLQDNCILMNIDTGLFRVDFCVKFDSPLPFVCKRVDNESCPTVDHDYKYTKVSRKCYKVNKKPKMWQEAMQTCFMEGGILTVIENSAEADVLNEMTNSGKTYFVGVRRIFSLSDFYSVKGQKSSELYQGRYNDNNNDNNNNCGVVYKDGSLRPMTADCGSRLPFICEMEVGV